MEKVYKPKTITQRKLNNALLTLWQFAFESVCIGGEVNNSQWNVKWMRELYNVRFEFTPHVKEPTNEKKVKSDDRGEI